MEFKVILNYTVNLEGLLGLHESISKNKKRVMEYPNQDSRLESYFREVENSPEAT